MAVERFPHFIDTTGTNVVLLQLVKANFTGGLDAALGIAAGANETGEAPNGKSLIGEGKTAAMENGCFGVNLVYQKTAKKKQTAKVLCSPSKADTIFKEGKGKKFKTFDIVDVRIPRRRIYSF